MVRLRLIFSEVAIGLRRNLTMTIATVITFAVSLSLFGMALMVRSQVDTMKDYWYDKVQVSIFLCTKSSDSSSCAQGAVTDAQRDQIQADLDSLKPLVEDVFFETSQQAYERFEQQFRNSPIAANVSADALPESFRVKLSDPTQYSVIASMFTGRPGVDNVVDQRQLLDRFFQVLGGLQAGALAIALVMIVVTALLIANTMRVAAFSRRRETSIMRLVGASSFSIQMPFILEAAIGAAVGAAIAGAVLIAFYKFVVDGMLRETFTFTAFIGWDTVVSILPVLLITGVVLAAVTALVTLRRYLRV